MDKWKRFFDSSGSDIWTVIDWAITVAAVESPAELRLRRDKFTEKMFCPPAHLAGLCDCEEEDVDPDPDHDSDVSEAKGDHETIADEEEEDDRADNNDVGCNDADVEALSDEMEAESREKEEILRIKNMISDPNEFGDCLCEPLERLENMHISYDLIKATGIKKSVINLREHKSEEVRRLVKRILRGWDALAAEWSKSVEVVTGRSEGNDENYGLPSPPLDEHELLAARTTPMEMSKLFELMDEDISGGSGDSPVARTGRRRNWGDGSQSPSDKPRQSTSFRKPRNDDAEINRVKEKSRSEINKESHIRRSSNEQQIEKSSSTSRQPQPPPQKSSSLPPPKQKPSSSSSMMMNGSGHRSSDSYSKEKSRLNTTKKSEQGGEKLEVAKRKLHEGYLQAENAKKQRTVQVMELQDLPKKGGSRGGSTSSKPVKSHHTSLHNKLMRRS